MLWVLCLAGMVGLSLAAGAETAKATSVDWAHGCMPYIPEAEAYYKLPTGILQAVALTESGQDGQPYPWALNIGGQAYIAPSYEEAARALRLPDGRPREDVAVGCMQIYMHYHLKKFVEPEWALHPIYNIWYGASYLRELANLYGDWPSAIAHYNGSDPAAQRTYLCMVANRLATTSLATLRALGLQTCGSVPIAASKDVVVSPRVPNVVRQRMSIMAARRVGRIIVLGNDRF
jgi:hypothetical protein